jgi:glyoxylase-like metal-dependent hydrolase (beta-lactamase superfamily II)
MSLCIRPLSGNSQRLDGGAMFGNAPRAVWSRWLPPDELGRVPLACRAALITQGDRQILLETGVGAFFNPKSKERYGVLEEEHVLLDSLAAYGLGHADIDVVVLSHLHFDHAGGLLAKYSEGSALELLFPKARFIVSQTGFERALAPHARDRASFIPELQALLQASGRLELIADGQTESATLGREFELSQTQGHTPGMLHTLVRGQTQSVFFCADLVPGRPWVHLPITMGYDRFAEALIDEKSRLFAGFVKDKTWLYFTHDPDVAMARISRDDSGRYAPTEVRKHAGQQAPGAAPAFGFDTAPSMDLNEP